jgi:hypothetical protein
MIDTNIIFNSITAFCLIVATVFSYRNFTLIKTMENENHFYKYKMESAQKLVVASMSLINHFQEIMNEVLDLKEQNKFDTDANNIIDSKIDFHFDEFRKSVIENSLFLPQNIIDEIEKFYEMFFEETDFLGTDEEIEKYFDELLDKIEFIIELIRNDLGVEKLNIKLKKRLKVK